MIEGRLGYPTRARQHVHGGAVVAVTLEGHGALLQQMIAADLQRSHVQIPLTIWCVIVCHKRWGLNLTVTECLVSFS
ncbi:hypothetical protein D3C75_1214710 [compost metagenome]